MCFAIANSRIMPGASPVRSKLMISPVLRNRVMSGPPNVTYFCMSGEIFATMLMLVLMPTVARP